MDVASILPRMFVQPQRGYVIDLIKGYSIVRKWKLTIRGGFVGTLRKEVSSGNSIFQFWSAFLLRTSEVETRSCHEVISIHFIKFEYWLSRSILKFMIGTSSKVDSERLEAQDIEHRSVLNSAKLISRIWGARELWIV